MEVCEQMVSLRRRGRERKCEYGKGSSGMGWWGVGDLPDKEEEPFQPHDASSLLWGNHVGYNTYHGMRYLIYKFM
jgi:hypothetical protein